MITESQDGGNRFYHFPINVLFTDGVVPSASRRVKVFQDAISYVLIEVATSLKKQWESDQVAAMADAYIAANPHLSVEVDSYDAVCFLAAHKSMNVTCPKFDFTEKHKTHRQIANCGFGQSRVSLNAEYFWECSQKSESLDWREFSLLCAVYAAIGRDACKCIKYERLAAMALGFSSVAELDDHNQWLKEKRFKPIKTLTTKQARTTLEKLERRNFFLTASPDGRHKYYTVQLRPFDRLLAYLVKADREKAKRRPLSQSERTEAIRRALDDRSTTDDSTQNGGGFRK